MGTQVSPIRFNHFQFSKLHCISASIPGIIMLTRRAMPCDTIMVLQKTCSVLYTLFEISMHLLYSQISSLHFPLPQLSISHRISHLISVLGPISSTYRKGAIPTKRASYSSSQHIITIKHNKPPPTPNPKPKPKPFFPPPI